MIAFVNSCKILTEPQLCPSPSSQQFTTTPSALEVSERYGRGRARREGSTRAPHLQLFVPPGYPVMSGYPHPDAGNMAARHRPQVRSCSSPPRRRGAQASPRPLGLAGDSQWERGEGAAVWARSAPPSVTHSARAVAVHAGAVRRDGTMASDFYLRYYVGHKGKFGHEFLEFEFRPDGERGGGWGGSSGAACSRARRP